ncbi:MAG: hypothetical protein WC254_00030 [Candidatus Woesearchaeota archaeon]|jgi:hypothetical protein
MKNTNMITTLTGLAALTLSTPLYAQSTSEEAYWADVPIEAHEVPIGKYVLTEKEQTIVWQEDVYAWRVQSRTLDTLDSNIINSVYQVLNGVAAQIIIVPGKDSIINMSCSPSTYLREHPEDADLFVHTRGLMGILETYTNIETDPRAEKVIQIIYDRNHNGKLSEKEKIKGEKKFTHFLRDAVLEQVPLDGNYHAVFVADSSLNGFEKQFDRYHPQHKSRREQRKYE